MTKTKPTYSFSKGAKTQTKPVAPKREAQVRGGQMTASTKHAMAHRNKTGY